MKAIILIITICVAILSGNTNAIDSKTITFPSLDGLEITADAYISHSDKNTPLILLFHQAGWSRGEYLEIAPKLNSMGFNCIAVDQRSGKAINGVSNETAQRAVKNNQATRYIDALPDIEAALHYANENYSESKIIAWGSSYSSSLVLQIAGDKPKLVDGVLSFAPGEYFSKQNKSKTWIRDSAKNINIPVFITSAKNEKNNWSAIYAAIKSEQKTSFLPSSKGNHGSKALWDQFDDSEQYWNAVSDFLTNNFL